MPLPNEDKIIPESKQAPLYQSFQAQLDELAKQAPQHTVLQLVVPAREGARPAVALYPTEFDAENVKEKLQQLKHLQQLLTPQLFVSFRRVCNKPRNGLKTISEVRPIDTVKRIGYEAISHLAAHPENWQARRANGVLPARLFSRVSELDFAIYENRFVLMVLGKLLKNLDRKRQEWKMIDRLNELQQFKGGQFAVLKYDRAYEERLKEIFGILEGAHLPPSEKAYQQIRRLYSQYYSLLATPLYRYTHRTKRLTDNNIHETNILLFDKDYRAIYHFWRAAKKTLGPVQEEKNVPIPTQAYASFCRCSTYFSLHSLGFSGNDDCLQRHRDKLRVYVQQNTQEGIHRLTLQLYPARKLPRTLWKYINPAQVTEHLEKIPSAKGEWELSDNLYWWKVSDEQIRLACGIEPGLWNKALYALPQPRQSQHRSFTIDIFPFNTLVQQQIAGQIKSALTDKTAAQNNQQNTFSARWDCLFPPLPTNYCRVFAVPELDEEELAKPHKLPQRFFVLDPQPNAVQAECWVKLSLLDTEYRRMQRILLGAIAVLQIQQGPEGIGICPFCGRPMRYETNTGRYVCDACCFVAGITVCRHCNTRYYYTQLKDLAFRELNRPLSAEEKETLFAFRDLTDYGKDAQNRPVPLCPHRAEHLRPAQTEKENP